MRRNGSFTTTHELSRRQDTSTFDQGETKSVDDDYHNTSPARTHVPIDDGFY